MPGEQIRPGGKHPKKASKSGGVPKAKSKGGSKPTSKRASKQY
jgi:hypothetical protein